MLTNRASSSQWERCVMAGKDVKLLRRAQTISPFGVGSIIEVNGESFVPADISNWGADGERIQEERLEKFLGVDHFRMGPPAPERPWEADANTPGIPCVRFPAWFFCPDAGECTICHLQRRCQYVITATIIRNSAP